MVREASVSSAAVTIAQLMIPELQREAAMTRSLLERVPADKLDWSPGGDLRTIGWNAGHLADIVGWVRGTLEHDELDFTDESAAAWMGPTDDLAAILKRFDAHLADSLAALEGVADDVMAEPWTMKMSGHPLFTMPKGDVLRKWVFTHQAHHRGILSTYLKMAGVKFSSIYEE